MSPWTKRADSPQHKQSKEQQPEHVNDCICIYFDDSICLRMVLKYKFHMDIAFRNYHNNSSSIFTQFLVLKQQWN